MPLTKRQRETLNLLISAADKSNIAKVSMGAISKHLGKGGAGQIIYALILKGYIKQIVGDSMQEGNSYKILKTK